MVFEEVVRSEMIYSSSTSFCNDIFMYLHIFTGSLMVIAWIGFGFSAIFYARHMRNTWGKKKICGSTLWFQVVMLIVNLFHDSIDLEIEVLFFNSIVRCPSNKGICKVAFIEPACFILLSCNLQLFLSTYQLFHKMID